MIHVKLPIAFVLLFAAACSSAPPLVAQEKATASTQSRIQRKTYNFEEAGKEMEYGLFVPTAYAKERKSPLIVALHGLGGNPQVMMRYRGLTDLAEKHGYIVVAPMGYNSRGWYGTRGPKGGKSGDPENLGELSEKDVINVLELIRKDYSIDAERIYLLGHSMGGGGTFHFAIKHPEMWAALAPTAPALFRPATDVAQIKEIPVILVQGDKDNLCPVERARRWAEEMKKNGMTYEYVEVAGGDHISVAAQNMPKIFEFFGKHKRGELKSKADPPADGKTSK